MFKKSLIIVLYFLLYCNSSFANTEPICKKVIPKNHLKSIDNQLPQKIEIEVNNNRKWLKHNLRMIKNTLEHDTGGNIIIAPKYKKKFKATLHVYFNNDINILGTVTASCNISASGYVTASNIFGEVASFEQLTTAGDNFMILHQNWNLQKKIVPLTLNYFILIFLQLLELKK